MYARMEKPKENKSRAVANSVAQKKRSGKQKELTQLIRFSPPQAMQDETYQRLQAAMNSSHAATVQRVNSGVIQRDEYDEEITAYNKGKGPQERITDSEKPFYKKLRRSGFEQGEIKMPKSGADFIANNSEKLWMVEVKGSNSGSWTKDANLNFESGSHVPAKQIKQSIESKSSIFKHYLEEKSSKLFESKKLNIIVSNLQEADALMALVLNDEKNIVEQHPVTVSQVVQFVLDNGGNDPEGLLEKLLEDDVEKVISEWMLDTYSDVADFTDTALENYVVDWSKRDEEAKIQNFDCLESLYNAARLSIDHDISTSNLGANNPRAVKSLTTLSQYHELKLHIRLLPVGNRL